MSINNIKNKLKQISIKDTTWIERAKFRKGNQDWLDISFAIAVRMFSILKDNKKKNIFPKSQKELAIALDCTPQYVNKLLKGSEKLNIETISKIQKALRISIISNDFDSQKVKIVAQHERVFQTPKRAIKKNYKKTNSVVQYNLAAGKGDSYINVYTR